MHLHRRSLRHITWMVLVVWLLALGAGVANACLLNAPNDISRSSLLVAHPATPVVHAHQQEQPDPGTAGCLKFCDEPVLAIKKLDLSASDVGAGVVGTLPPALVPAAASGTVVRLPVLSHRPAHLALPIAVRPHRLTL